MYPRGGEIQTEQMPEGPTGEGTAFDSFSKHNLIM